MGTVSLTFSDMILDLGGGAGSLIRVRDEAGGFYGDGCVVLSGDTMSAAMSLGDAGTYEVQWRVSSVDGHPISDSYTFAYAPPAGTAVAEGQAEPPTCEDSSGSTGTGAEATDSAQAPSPWLYVGLAGGALLMIGGAVGVVIGGRIRRKGRQG